MDTPAHCANLFSPLTAEVDDEPPHPPVGESDTDSVEFHAIRTPADSDSGEEIYENSEPEDAEEASTFDPPHEDIAPTGVDVARAAMARGFRSLDQITLDIEFRSRGCLM